MKLRVDFITNSSSASFTLVIRFRDYDNADPWTEEGFRDFIYNCFYCDDRDLNTVSYNINRDTITMKAGINDYIMFNSYSDVPVVMRELILASHDPNFSGERFDVLHFESEPN